LASRIRIASGTESTAVANDHAQGDDDPRETLEKQRPVFLGRVEQCKRWAIVPGPLTQESVDAARAVSRAWARRAKQMADAMEYWDAKESASVAAE
jgi:hypothetical protein